MTTTSKLFNHLSVLLLLCFCVALMGCGGNTGGGGTASTPKDPKTAINEVRVQWEAAVQRFRTRNEAASFERGRVLESLETFKNEGYAISLADCPQDFVDAFGGYRLYSFRMLEYGLNPPSVTAEEGQIFYTATWAAVDRLNEVCRKYGVEANEHTGRVFSPVF